MDQHSHATRRRKPSWAITALVAAATGCNGQPASEMAASSSATPAASPPAAAAPATATAGTSAAPTSSSVTAPAAARGGAGAAAVGGAGAAAVGGAGVVAAVGGAGSGGSPAAAGSGGSAGATGGAPAKDMWTGPKTDYPGRRWSVPQPTHGAVIESDVSITMSDGVKLVGDVSYPAELGTRQRASGKFPVILTQNPYGAAFGAASGEIFVTHGYIFASIDVRGTSRSTGVHDMFAPREAEDGAELVKWAAALEGGDGRVGLHGCSQLGINQLETASKLGPGSPVKAMIPACGSGDFYRDTAFDNGIPTAVGEALVGVLDAAQRGDALLYRDYWKIRDRVARAPAMAAADIPMLLWAGWHEPGALGSLELYVALQNLAAGRPAGAAIRAGSKLSGKYQVILGDWAHAGGLDQGVQLQWFDTWIKGLDTGLPKETETPLHLAELGGSKRWVNAASYPLVATYTPLYLASAGKLSRTPDASAGQDELKWVAPGTTSGFVDYASEPFAQGALLAGPMAARLEAASSNANAQLVVDIFDRAPGGEQKRISRGSVLGSLRRTAADKSWADDKALPTRPYLTLDEHQPLTPGQPTRLEFPLWPAVYTIEPGHSVVVRVSTQPRSEDCGDLLGVPVGCNVPAAVQDTLRGGVYQLQRGGEQGSLVSLPLLERGALTTAESAVSPTGKVSDPFAKAIGVVEYPLPVDW